MSLHARTRSKKIVNQLYKLGLSVSYHRVDEIMNNLATSVCDHFKSVGVVCPLSLQRSLFTVGAIDNIDHNPSSTTAQGSFHGTGISLFQFPKQDSEVNHQQAVQRVSLCSTRTASRDITLPDAYSSAPSVSIKTSEVNVPSTGRTGVETSSGNQLSTAIEKQIDGLKHLNNIIMKSSPKVFIYHGLLITHLLQMCPILCHAWVACCHWLTKRLPQWL